MDCWAAEVDPPCGGGPSKEHRITRGLHLEDEVNVFGYPFLQGEERRLPLDALVTHCLCEKHNNALSDVDQAAIDFANAKRSADDLTGVRGPRRRPAGGWTHWQLTLDGLRLERWCLKTAINIAMTKKREPNPWQPPTAMRRAALGLQPILEPCGLGLIQEVRRTQVDAADSIAVNFISDRGGHPAGVLVAIVGYFFICTWDRPPSAVLPLRYTAFSAESAVYRPVEIGRPELGISLRLNRSLNFRVPRAVADLRAKYRPPPR